MNAGCDVPIGLLERMRAATGEWHRAVEASPLMSAFVRGQVTRDDYTRYLAALWPVYDALENALERLPEQSTLSSLRVRACYRASAIAADLAQLGGGGRRPMPSTLSSTIERWARTAPHCLAAAAYVRYLGDLSGGRVLRDRIAEALGLGDDELAFFTYDPSSPAALRRQLLAALAGLRLDARQTDEVVAASVRCFAEHLPLFEGVRSAVA